MKFTHNQMVRVVSPQPFGCTRLGCRCTKVWSTAAPGWPDYRWRITGEVSAGFRRKLSKVLKRMVGLCGLEPQTFTVSKRLHHVLPIT